jgi:hypothetical protein
MYVDICTSVQFPKRGMVGHPHSALFFLMLAYIVADCRKLPMSGKRGVSSYHSVAPWFQNIDEFADYSILDITQPCCGPLSFSGCPFH